MNSTQMTEFFDGFRIEAGRYTWTASIEHPWLLKWTCPHFPRAWVYATPGYDGQPFSPVELQYYYSEDGRIENLASIWASTLEGPYTEDIDPDDVQHSPVLYFEQVWDLLNLFTPKVKSIRDEDTRLACLKACARIDRNGCWSDEDSEAEGWPPCDLTHAITSYCKFVDCE